MRTILRATFPSNVSIRPTQQIVYHTLDAYASIGYISELRVGTGRKARQFTRQLDYSNSGRVIVGQDETFFHGAPILMVIEPISMTILLAEVCADRQAERALALSRRVSTRCGADRLLRHRYR